MSFFNKVKEVAVDASDKVQEVAFDTSQKVQEMYKNEYFIVECTFEQYNDVINSTNGKLICTFTIDNKIIVTFKK
jgi:hypothetical protein